MSGLVNLTVNGKKVAVQKGTLLVEAAKQAGIEIPVFCYHEKLAPVGACRMCLCEIEKMPRLQTACTTPVAEGMVANSVSANAVAGQNAVLELLLANHPLDCPICDKGGECPLQDNTFKYGRGSSRMHEDKRRKDKAYPLSDKIALDKERCIMCYRCTRFQAEIAGDSALVALERGSDSEIGTLTGEPFTSPFSGNTIELCPVGALTSRQYRFRARPWDLQRTPSVCSGCAVGCSVSLHARDGAILRLVAREHREVDDGWLCDHGRFATLPPVTAPGQVAGGDPASRRPLQPLLRQGGRLAPATHEAAILRAAELLRGQSAVLASPALSNEAVTQLLTALQPALANGRIGFLPRAHTPWLVQGRIANLPQCKKVLLLGLDPWTELPVLALWVRKAALAGGTVVAIGPHNGLFRDTAAWQQVEAGKVRAAAQELLAALAGGLAGGAAGDAARGLASKLQRDGAAAVLLHPELAHDPALLATAQQLAQRLGASADTGLLGAPAFGSNARGVQELAPGLASAAVATDGLQALLLLGIDPLPPVSGARLVVASARAVADRADIDVVLPLAHPYETAGTCTNLEGRRQRLEAGGFAGRGVLQDHALVAQLARALHSRLLAAR